MLNIFRKHATSWLIKVALFLIVIVFIFWGGYSYNSQKASQMARVDDHYISINDYNQAYNQLLEVYRRQFGDAFSEDLIRRFNLKKQALDMLINRYVLTKAAQELGLTATTREIQDQVLEYPVFQKDGKFDQNLYVRVLQQNRLTPEAFEQKLAEDLTTRKLESFIKRQAVVTEGEIRSDFLFNHDTIQLDYVILDPKSYEDQVTMDEKAVETYFKEHQDRYKDPEKRQLSYVLFKTDDYLADVQVTNDEILQKYEENKDQYHHEPEVHARHILFIVAENAPEEEVARVRAEARKVLDEAKKGKDFGELAKKYSQDPSAAQNGGDLGYFKRHEMVDAFSDAAFAMKPGQISDLVRSPYGFHIIKVEDVRPERTESLEEARNAIEKSLKEEKARALAYEKAQTFEDAAYARKDIGKTAEEQKVQLTGNGVWVSEKDSLPGMKEMDPDLMKKIFTLGEKEVSDVLESPEGYLVAEVTAVQGPQVPPLEKVKDRVQEDLKKEKAGELAKAKASELLLAAKNLKSLEQAARQMKMDVRKSDWFSRRQPDKDLLLLQGNALNSVFQMEESNPFPEAPLSLGNRYAVVQLLGKKSSDEGLEKERDSISRRLYQMKQGMLWQSWIEEERSKAKVEIYKEL